MDFLDLIILGFSNLWRTKLRTFLTILGVVIGIGALTSMVSFGTGMQKNITDAFASNDLFTSITVTSKPISFDEVGPDSQSHAAGMPSSPDEILLTDSLLETIRIIPGVALAYPNLEFPARIRLMDDSASFTVSALPAAIGQYKPYSDLLAGTFFSSDSAKSVVIDEETLRSRFKIRLTKAGEEDQLSQADSLKGVKLMHPDSLIGKTISLVSMSINPAKITASLMGFMSNKPGLPFDESFTELAICGVLKNRGQFASNVFRGGLIIPVATAGEIPKLGFSSVWDLLDNSKKEGTYGSIHVRLHDMNQMDEVKKALEDKGVSVFTVADQLTDIRRAFMILNAALGAIGAIALIVAGLGITNTMVMSILERTREIGIMKAIGGSEQQIRMVFFVEASVIGVIGAFAGLALGWVVTRIANMVLNTQLMPEGLEPVDLFYFPPWLIMGAIAFSILVSLVAGLYPAFRASRIDPVRALRHD